MRVISGKYKGKKIEGFNIDGTRPTMDRVKESVFASIQNNIKGATCLDLFAGSGSLGIEALSNGAHSCYFVDSGSIAYQTLEKNVRWIEEEIYTYKMDYRKALQMFHEKRIQFDLIFLDPPYALHVLTDSLKKIEEYNLLKEDGFVICEYETERIQTNYSCIKNKRYGSTYISVYKHNQ